MNISNDNKNVIVNEFLKVHELMNGSKNNREKLFYFSATYAMVSRILNIEYNPTLIFIHSVLLSAHNNINSFVSNIINTKNNFYKIPENYFDILEDNLRELTGAITNNDKTNIYNILEKITVLGYITTGNGNYLYKKGMIKL